MEAVDGGPCFERMEVMEDPTPRGGALNMALDEVFLHRLRGLPLLRLYRWARPAGSFGYFEPITVVRRLTGEREIVRRWTGGGIVLHGDDLTYSLLVPRSFPLTNTPAAQSYAVVHAVVARALAQLGWQARGHAGPAATGGSHACFERPVPHDLIAAGRKVAGAAQRRTRVGLLHQGSIQAAAGEGRETDWRSALSILLPQSFSDSLVPRAVCPEEISLAERLAADKYATPAWTEKF